jgi:thioredoxin reductase
MENNRKRLEDARRSRRVEVLLESNVVEIKPDRVVLKCAENVLARRNDAVIVNVGGTLPTDLLRQMGIMVEVKHGTA